MRPAVRSAADSSRTPPLRTPKYGCARAASRARKETPMKALKLRAVAFAACATALVAAGSAWRSFR